MSPNYRKQQVQRYATCAKTKLQGKVKYIRPQNDN